MVIRDSFLNLHSPYVRDTLNRNGKGGQEEKSLSNPAELSTATEMKPHSSRTKFMVVDICVSEA